MIKIEQKKLATFIEIIRALVPECRLWVTVEGWLVKSVDTANVAMVQILLKADAFEEYTEKGKTEVGVDLIKWANAMKFCKDSPIEIGINGVGMDGKIAILDGKYTYTVMQLDPSTIRKDPNSPALNLPAGITVAGKDLFETIKAMGIVSDKIRVSIGPGGLSMYAEGDTDHVEKTLEGTGNTVTIETAKATALFSKDYLIDIGKVMSGVPEVSVHLANDHPVRFDYEKEGQEITFLLAPRIEADL